MKNVLLRRRPAKAFSEPGKLLRRGSVGELGVLRNRRVRNLDCERKETSTSGRVGCESPRMGSLVTENKRPDSHNYLKYRNFYREFAFRLMNIKRFSIDTLSWRRRGIRTLGRVSPTHAFQACSFNHSDISPSLESRTCERSPNRLLHTSVPPGQPPRRSRLDAASSIGLALNLLTGKICKTS